MKNTNLSYGRPSLHTQLLTLYTHGRLPTLGTICSVNRAYVWKPNAWGRTAEAVLKNMQDLSRVILVQEYVVMPNHIHILVSYRHHTPHILNWFVLRCKQMMSQPILRAKQISCPVWERSFHSIEIRHDNTLRAICENLREHHSHWQYDTLCKEARVAVRKEEKSKI